MIVGFVIGRDTPAVAVTLEVIFALDEPDLLRLVVGQIVRGRLCVNDAGTARACVSRIRLAVASREVVVDAMRRPDGGRADAADEEHDQGETDDVEEMAGLIKTEIDARRHRRFLLAQQVQPRAHARRQILIDLAHDQTIEQQVEQPRVVALIKL